MMRTRSPRLGGEEGRGREELGTGVGLRGARRMTVRARIILTIKHHSLASSVSNVMLLYVCLCTAAKYINICKPNYCTSVTVNLLSYRVPASTPIMRLLATFLVLLLT